MRYMIHSSPPRQWYVDEFLLPALVNQGIQKENIIVWEDIEEKGVRQTYMEAFEWCGKNPANGTWHIQDDILISRKFRRLTEEFNDGVVCGFVNKISGPDWRKTGVQKVEDLWYSFPCIHIPDAVAGECAKWFFEDAQYRMNEPFVRYLKTDKYADEFFWAFLREEHPTAEIINLTPNIADHVDYLIGGSLINGSRPMLINRAAYWEDEDLVEKLAEDLRKRNEQ